MRHSGGLVARTKAHSCGHLRTYTCGDIKDAGRNARTNERNSSPEAKVNDSLARSLARSLAPRARSAISGFDTFAVISATAALLRPFYSETVPPRAPLCRRRLFRIKGHALCVRGQLSRRTRGFLDGKHRIGKRANIARPPRSRDLLNFFPSSHTLSIFFYVLIITVILLDGGNWNRCAHDRSNNGDGVK